MVEIRIGVDDATRAPALMWRLKRLFDRSDVSFDRARKEVRLTSEWESRAVVGVVDAVEEWLADGGGDSATLSVGDRSYTVGRPGPAAEPVVDLGRRGTLRLVREVSLAGRGGPDSTELLEQVCDLVSRAFGFDSVTAVRLHAGAAEVSDAAAVGVVAADPNERRALARTPLLTRALESEELALGDGGSTFAVPLIGAGRCLGFLCGSRLAANGADADEAEALTTLGVVVSTLLESALLREDAQRLDVLKSEFIALAAHELRNPLSSIYGICLTLEERGETLAEAERGELRSALSEQAVRMRRLIEQLLDLSRFDLAAIHVAPESLRLLPKVEELVHALGDARAQAVLITVPSDLEVVVDPVALDRMLSNLVANALRYGEPPVTVTAARRDTHLRLAVADCGDGVPGEFVPRLFERFTRSPEALRQTDGSGLGLAIAQAYARAHGGDIVYEPAVPHGSRFEVVLPLGAAEAHPAP